MKILILGAGRMGLGAAYDLAHNSPDVEAITIADIDAERARAVAATVGSTKLTPVPVDVTNAAQVVALMRGHDAECTLTSEPRPATQLSDHLVGRGSDQRVRRACARHTRWADHRDRINDRD